MPQCPNCNYKLVFLQGRLKYKCAKCGRLFLQKFIENKDFQTWNKNQRKVDEHNIKLETKQRKERPKLNPEERKRRNKDCIKRWQIRNRNKCRKYCEKYYEKNREKVLVNKKLYAKVAKNKIKVTKRIYRLKNLEKTRLFSRITRWRQKQKNLALEELQKKDLNSHISYDF